MFEDASHQLARVDGDGDVEKKAGSSSNMNSNTAAAADGVAGMEGDVNGDVSKLLSAATLSEAGAGEPDADDGLPAAAATADPSPTIDVTDTSANDGMAEVVDGEGDTNDEVIKLPSASALLGLTSCAALCEGNDACPTPPSSSSPEINDGNTECIAGVIDGEGDIIAVLEMANEIRKAGGTSTNNDVSKLSSAADDASPPSSQSTPEINGTGTSSSPEHPQTRAMAHDFATEHGIFLRAILDLLSERDHLAVDADVNSLNTIKMGSLRKKSRRIKGLWKTKFVEIRKGTFSYFDDSGKHRSSARSTDVTASTITDDGGTMLRKDIPLRASSCTCRAVKIRSVKILSSNTGAVFELKIQGGSRRLWMANTREERQSWIKAIHDAMIGASVTRGDNFLEYQVEQREGGKNRKDKGNSVPANSPYRTFLEKYLEVREATNDASSKDEYLAALSSLRGRSITVPVQWLKSQLDNTPAAASFLEAGISSSVEQLWKDLLRDSVEVNGEVVAGDSFHGPERIVGMLTQQILSFDASLQGAETRKSISWDRTHTQISEAQAVSYARDILLASDRTRSGGDSYFCAENLCLNRNLIVLCPSSTEANPLSIKVFTEYHQKSEEDCELKDVIGWALARKSSSKPWTRQYLVLSNGVLSCYAEAEPKPHILIEQVVLQGAKIGESPNNARKSKGKAAKQPDESDRQIVHITTKDGRVARDYLFEDDWDFLLWNGSLKKSASFLDHEPQQNGATKRANGHRNTSNPSPAVDVMVNVCTEYKLCTLDPSGIESEDTWAALRTTFVQKFSLTGGPNGRISRGDEVVQLELL